MLMIPYENEIKIGETLSFNVNGLMMPVQVTGIGYNEITAVSLDLKFKWQINKSKWIKQRELLQEYGVK